MKSSVICVATAIGIVASSQALAETVVIAPEERTILRDYVVKQKIKPRRFKERVVVGGTFPGDVEVAPVPEGWPTSVRRYHYVYGEDDRIIFVDPSSRRVIHVD